jgi:hypothetical protein
MNEHTGDDDALPTPVITADAFAALAALIALVADPKSCGARLRSLQEHQAAAALAVFSAPTARRRLPFLRLSRGAVNSFRYLRMAQRRSVA